MHIVICEKHASHPGGGENVTSLLHGNIKVINELKTAKAYPCVLVAWEIPGILDI